MSHIFLYILIFSFSLLGMQEKHITKETLFDSLKKYDNAFKSFKGFFTDIDTQEIAIKNDNPEPTNDFINNIKPHHISDTFLNHTFENNE